MREHCDTSELWERVGYLSAQAIPGKEVLAALRVVLQAIDHDATGDVVSLHANLTRVLLGGEQ